MLLMLDLFSFAYAPNCFSPLDILADIAFLEPCRFNNPISFTKN